MNPEGSPLKGCELNRVVGWNYGQENIETSFRDDEVPQDKGSQVREEP